MRAAVVKKPGELVLEDVPKPEPRDSDVLVKVRTAAICNAVDRHILEGTASGYLDHYPQILGHEISGEVVNVGSQVDDVDIGERIVFFKLGGFTEYVTLDITKYAFARVPVGLSDEEAPLCEMLHGSLIGTVFPAHIKPWERVLIIGQGPQGLLILQLVKVLGAEAVSVVDCYKNRVKKSEELGADYAYSYSDLSTDEIVRMVRKDMGLSDLTVMCVDEDLSPTGDVGKLATDTLVHGGRLTGLTVEIQKPGPQIDLQAIFQKNLKVSRELASIYDHNSLELQKKAWQQGVDWVSEGKINMAALVTHHVSLEDVEKGVMLCRDEPETCIKVIVHIGD